MIVVEQINRLLEKLPHPGNKKFMETISTGKRT